jgi:formylglycine-generating enzyme required for sulfatase activity
MRHSNPVQLLLQALCRDPADSLAWLALADAQEEMGQVHGAELTRLREQLRFLEPDDPRRPALQQRLQELLAQGVVPVMPTWTRYLLNGAPIAFHLIPPGRFQMGCPPDEPHRHAADPPLGFVHLDRPFWIGRTLLTQAQLGTGSSAHPALVPYKPPFLERLQQRWKTTVRWPTENEWEYACRAATTSRYHGGGIECVPLVAWCAYGQPTRERPRTKAVAQLVPNAWGLYDMHGNLWEWLQESSRLQEILTAGGCFRAIPQRCTATARMVRNDGRETDIIGGRLVLEWNPEQMPRSSR